MNKHHQTHLFIKEKRASLKKKRKKKEKFNTENLFETTALWPILMDIK